MAATKRNEGAPKNGMPPTHPGEFLTDVTLPGLYEAHGWTKTDFAAALGVPRDQLEKVMAEAASVTPSLALRLARVLGGSAQFWMNLQTAYDLRKAELAMADQLKALKPLPPAKAA